jgi:hypothetical protein
MSRHGETDEAFLHHIHGVIQVKKKWQFLNHLKLKIKH